MKEGRREEAGEKCDNMREELEQRREKAAREGGSHADRKLTGSRKHDIQSELAKGGPDFGT